MSILNDIKVLELCEVYQGPLASQSLADFGAQVIKVEKPGSGDITRMMDYDALVNQTMSSPFASINRNKQSICVDIRTDQGREIIHALVKESDVLLHNYRPGVMERLGLGYEALSAINPTLIYAAASGYGETGPLAMTGGQEMLVQSLSGYCANNSGDGKPIIVNAPAIDFGSGMVLVQGVLLALLERQQSGKGQKVSTSLLGTAAAIQQMEIATVLNTGNTINYFDMALNFILPTTDVSVFVLGFFGDNPLGRMCDAVGVKDMSVGFNIDIAMSADKLKVFKADVEKVLVTASKQLSSEELLSQLRKKDVMCAPILNIQDAMSQAQIKEIEAIIELPVEGQKALKVVDTPLKFSRSSKVEYRSPPQLGEHTKEVLKHLGLNNGEHCDNGVLQH